MKVISICEECNGFIGLAKDMRSAFDFLLSSKWITENTDFPIEADDDSDFVTLEDLRKRFKFDNLLDTLLFMWENDEQWFEGLFYFYTETIYEST